MRSIKVSIEVPVLLVSGRGFERRHRSEQYFCGVEGFFGEGGGLRGAG